MASPRISFEPGPADPRARYRTIHTATLTSALAKPYDGPRPRPTPENLAKVRVLYRQDDTLSLWGIPYEMRADCNQSPRNIDKHWRGDWIWLGTPGWYGDMNADEKQLVKDFLTAHKDDEPQNPHEWCTLRTKES